MTREKTISTLETDSKEVQIEIRVLISLLSAQTEAGKKTGFLNLFLAEIYLGSPNSSTGTVFPAFRSDGAVAQSFLLEGGEGQGPTYRNGGPGQNH